MKRLRKFLRASILTSVNLKTIRLVSLARNGGAAIPSNSFDDVICSFHRYWRIYEHVRCKFSSMDELFARQNSLVEFMRKEEVPLKFTSHVSALSED